MTMYQDTEHDGAKKIDGGKNIVVAMVNLNHLIVIKRIGYLWPLTTNLRYQNPMMYEQM